MFEADDQRERKGRSRLVYTAATAGRRRSRQATAAAIASSGADFSEDEFCAFASGMDRILGRIGPSSDSDGS